MPENDLDLLIKAAKDAGKIASRFFNASAQVWDKPDGAGPVTEADLAVDGMLRETLMAARPDYGWLSEETEDDLARIETQRTFIIDPIDGTRAFIEGSKSWSHSLAIVENGISVAAVVYLPMMEKIYSASVGNGAYLNDMRLTVSDTDDMANATALTAKPNLFAEHWKDGEPPLKRSFRSSLAYRLSLVAEGRFDAMLTFRPTWEWDIAAGVLIVQEATGRASTQNGADLRFNNHKPQVNGVVAAGAKLHDTITSALIY
ncbi:inositol monophosphatase family protein [Parasulfitobacter algicola]|uniref:3'(2'),5'-bisphosphate nucleotidase CysQ n=1 Tax=Parasulfitobacter algicola TaxID=2614809 RepID=A0ABX2IUB5_9RHOB|nr:3'(2'),5'-bisphosphate nucleotidase CysQ [Sulfitobacter algicola]NSX53788.1 3'(2'),5'-bisphosphate nucleotidase CysQ [Sulfitobacter algicola]